MQPLEPQTVLNKVKSLPTLPQIFYKIIELIESPDSSVSDLEKIVSQDPSIAAKVLKVANSPLFAFGKQCIDIHQAIVRLGFETLKSIVLSISIFKFTPGREAASIFSREEFWRHSVGAAEAARLVAKKIRFVNPDSAYLIGLIHDIGKVILDFYFSEEYEHVGAYIKKHNSTIRHAEQEILGFDHALVGGWLADQWQFPGQLKASIQYHHTISLAPANYRIQTALAAIGNFIVRKEQFGSGGDSVDPVLHDDVIRLFELTTKNLDELQTSFRERLEIIDETCRLIE